MIADITGALAKKRAYLICEKDELKEEYHEKIREIDGKIEKINQAINVINDVLADHLCPRCLGKGTVRVCDAAGQMGDETCPDCYGTGIAFKE